MVIPFNFEVDEDEQLSLSITGATFAKATAATWTTAESYQTNA